MKAKTNIALHLSKLLKKNLKKALFLLALTIIVTCLNMLLPILTKMILDDAIPKKNIRLLAYIIIAFFVITISTSVMELCMDVIKSNIRKTYSANLKLQILNKLSKFDGRYLSNKHTGDLFKTLESDIYTIENFGIDTYIEVVAAGIEAVFSFFILCKMDLWLLVLVLLMQVVIVVLQKKFNAYSSKSIQKVRILAGRQADRNESYLSNLMNIIITGGKRTILRNYINGEREYVKQAIRTDFILGGSQISFAVLTGITTILIYLVGGLHVIFGTMTLGGMIAFSEYTMYMIGPIKKLVSMNNQIQQTKVSLDRVYGILKKSDDGQYNRGLLVSDIQLTLSFNEVAFSYEKRSIFNCLNLKMQTGKIYALIGGSGEGKSTIINLLYRLWEPNSGEIFLNDCPIAQYNLVHYRKLFSIVTQDSCLLDDTIYNNICWSKTYSRNEVEYVCKIVELWGWISSLEKGLDTMIGENGVKISGGQKQRIGIARALLKPSPILILDEATSAVDNITQKRIWENIVPYFNKKLVVIIAHRLETIKKADYIYILEDGKIVEEGTPEKLKEDGEVYWNLIKSEE